MRLTLIIEENEKEETFKIYLAKDLLATCNAPEEVEAFLQKFEKEHKDDSVILRFS